MKIEEKLNADFMTALKTGDRVLKSFLAVIKGDMQTIKKNLMVDVLPDEESIKILNKFAKGLKTNIAMPGGETPENLYELEVVESYLPKKMSEEDVKNAIAVLMSDGVTNIGDIMNSFKDKPVDRKMISEVFRELSK